MQTKFMTWLICVCSVGALEFDVYLIIDYRTSDFLRALVLDEIPFIGLILFVSAFLMSQLNAKSKGILTELDTVLHHRLLRTANGGSVVCKLTLIEQREMIATDQIALNVGDIAYLTRQEMISTIFQMVNYLFLIIDVNR